MATAGPVGNNWHLAVEGARQLLFLMVRSYINFDVCDKSGFFGQAPKNERKKIFYTQEEIREIDRLITSLGPCPEYTSLPAAAWQSLCNMINLAPMLKVILRLTAIYNVKMMLPRHDMDATVNSIERVSCLTAFGSNLVNSTGCFPYGSYGQIEQLIASFVSLAYPMPAYAGRPLDHPRLKEFLHNFYQLCLSSQHLYSEHLKEARKLNRENDCLVEQGIQNSALFLKKWKETCGVLRDIPSKNLTAGHFDSIKEFIKDVNAENTRIKQQLTGNYKFGYSWADQLDNN